MVATSFFLPDTHVTLGHVAFAPSEISHSITVSREHAGESDLLMARCGSLGPRREHEFQVEWRGKSRRPNAVAHIDALSNLAQSRTEVCLSSRDNPSTDAQTAAMEDLVSASEPQKVLVGLVPALARQSVHDISAKIKITDREDRP